MVPSEVLEAVTVCRLHLHSEVVVVAARHPQRLEAALPVMTVAGALRRRLQMPAIERLKLLRSAARLQKQLP
jgi:hypothetical protein